MDPSNGFFCRPGCIFQERVIFSATVSQQFYNQFSYSLQSRGICIFSNVTPEMWLPWITGRKTKAKERVLLPNSKLFLDSFILKVTTNPGDG